MRSPFKPSRRRGFTLVEVMIVVVIVGVLAAVAVAAYTKYTRKAKRTEVPFMVGHLQQRELSYQAENGSFLATGADEDDFFPASSDFEDGSGPDGTQANIDGNLPDEWRTLKVQPGQGALYCGYVVLAGSASDEPDGAALYLWDGTAPTRAWFYVVAQCNWDNDSDNELWRVRGDLKMHSEPIQSD